MNFHLDFQIRPFTKKIQYTEELFFMGSCFAENMAMQMQLYKFKTILNPNGVLYNPVSIAEALNRYVSNDLLEEKELFRSNEVFHSWEHHSRFSTADAHQCLTKINTQINAAHQSLKNTGWLFITLGSAYVYTHKQSGKRVGNCHKQPSQDFTKELLTTTEIVETYANLITTFQSFNKQLKMVFTVSPVRYIRDGMVENNRSKARLIEAVHQLCDEETVFYFPAYELLIDDLRDYRFYKSDLIHPNDQAIDYIFEKLVQAAFSPETNVLYEKIKDILKAKAHRVLQANSPAHQQFKSVYFERCKQLQKQYPQLRLKDELLHFG